MDKSELIKRVAKKTRLPQKTVADVVAASIKEIQSNLTIGRKVRIIGFGTFYTRIRPASESYSVRDREKIQVPEIRLAGFRPGLLLKKAVRQNLKQVKARRK